MNVNYNETLVTGRAYLVIYTNKRFFGDVITININNKNEMSTFFLFLYKLLPI